MIARLFRIELIKLRGRPAFYVAVVVYATLILIQMATLVLVMERSTSRDLAFPDFWRGALAMVGNLAIFVALITTVNVTAAEYGWRTSRQNVIDGLSREQWFAAKLIMVPAIALLFFVVGVGMVGVTGRLFVERQGSFITADLLRGLGGLLVGLTGMCSLAMLASFLTRHAGGAIALVVGYMIIGEGMIRALLRNAGESALKYAQYLPANTFQQLASMPFWSPPATRTPGAVVRGPEPPDPGTLLLLAAAYIAAAVGAAFLLMRDQDL